MALTFLQTAASTSDLTTYTFSSQNLGEAASDRYIVVAVHARSNEGGASSVSSVTVGGVSATIIQQIYKLYSNTPNVVALAMAKVPTGTTGNVVVTLNKGSLRCAIGLWRLTNIKDTPTDSGKSSDSTPTYNLDIKAGGYAIAAATKEQGAFTWTNITEKYDTTCETYLNYSGASDTYATAQTDLAISASSGNDPCAVFASFEKPISGGASLLMLL